MFLNLETSLKINIILNPILIKSNFCNLDKKEEKKKLRKEISTDQYDSSQNMVEDEHFGTLGSTNQDQGFGTVDSMPSSTQTAHSWIPGMQDGNQNVNNVVGRARSFEYLPGKEKITKKNFLFFIKSNYLP